LVINGANMVSFMKQSKFCCLYRFPILILMIWILVYLQKKQ
jgi:hypothetical protein